MEDTALADLTQQRKKLIKEITVLQDELEKQKNIVSDQSSVSTRTFIHGKENHTFLNKHLLRQKRKSCEFSFHATGILYENVDKLWLYDKVYKYTANVITKAISFYLELTLDLKDYPDFEVIDITCHFTEIKDCYMLEIIPWTQLLTKQKNYSLFMTAIYDYTEYNILRTKILDKLREDNYISYNDFEEENGGIIISIKSPRNNKQIYAKFQWSLKFFEETCRIEHNFTIMSTEFGIEFTEKNATLFKKFCKVDLKKKELTELWAELCVAIDTYENNDE